MGLLDGGISKIVSGAVQSIFLNYTLYKSARAVTTGKPWEPGTETKTGYTVKGFISDFSEYQKQNKTIQDGDRKITILAQGLTVEPATDDTIKVNTGETYVIVGPITCDPAKATYSFQARR